MMKISTLLRKQVTTSTTMYNRVSSQRHMVTWMGSVATRIKILFSAADNTEMLCNTMLARFHTELPSSLIRENSHIRLFPSVIRYTAGDPLINISNLMDRVDIQHIDALAECVKAAYPTQYKSRAFDTTPVRYSGDEVLLQSADDSNGDVSEEVYGGGNDVVFMEGYLQLAMPEFVDHILNVVSRASVNAGWHPYPKHLGLRCIEVLEYHSGGELKLHTDSESIFTVVIMLSDTTDDFTGGDFVIQRNNSATSACGTPVMVRSRPKQGDGIMFDSNAMHGVDRILTGQRRVLVLELWPYHDSQRGQKRPGSDSNANRIKIPKLLMP